MEKQCGMCCVDGDVVGGGSSSGRVFGAVGGGGTKKWVVQKS